MEKKMKIIHDFFKKVTLTGYGWKKIRIVVNQSLLKTTHCRGWNLKTPMQRIFPVKRWEMLQLV